MTATAWSRGSNTDPVHVHIVLFISACCVFYSPILCPLFSLLHPWGPSWHPSNCLCRITFVYVLRSVSKAGWCHFFLFICMYLTDCMKIGWFILRLVHGRVWCRVLLLRRCFMLFEKSYLLKFVDQDNTDPCGVVPELSDWCWIKCNGFFCLFLTLKGLLWLTGKKHQTVAHPATEDICILKLCGNEMKRIVRSVFDILTPV